MRKIRVLHIITRMSKGGAQENTLLNASRVNTGIFESTLMSGPSQDAEGHILDKVKSSGIPFVELPELVREPNPIKDTIAFEKIRRYLRNHSFDIVHTHCSKAGIHGRWAAYWNKVPIIVHSSHSHIFYGYFPSIITKGFVMLEKCAARISDRLQELTSRGVQEHIQQRVGREQQFKVVYSGQNLDAFLANPNETARKTIRDEFQISGDQVLVTSVARLVPIKGHAPLLKAFAKIREAAPSARLLLVGTGELETELQQLAADLGLENAVIFTGMRHDIADILAATDVFVLASLNEGMGRALVEAGASSLPCVASNVGGIPEVVQDGETGILVPPNDPDELALALLRLIDDPSLRSRMGNAGRAYAHPRFSIENMIRTIELDYLELARQKIPEFASLEIKELLDG